MVLQIVFRSFISRKMFENLNHLELHNCHLVICGYVYLSSQTDSLHNQKPIFHILLGVTLSIESWDWLVHFIQLSNLAEQKGNERLICKCGCVRVKNVRSRGALIQCICEWVVLYCLGKTLSTIHVKPSPSLSLPVFPSLSSLQQLLSCLSWQLEPSSSPTPPTPSSSRHRQELTDLLTYTNTLSFCLSRPCPALVWLLTEYWPHFGLRTEEQVFPLFYLAAVIACSHYCARASWLFVEMLSW